MTKGCEHCGHTGVPEAEKYCDSCRGQLCECGSGRFWDRAYDARGIYLCRVCPSCRTSKLSRYRPEVLTDPGYEADEPIDDY